MKQTITITIGGDLLVGSRQMYQQIEADSFQVHKLIPPFDTLFGDADITFLNFEGTITNSDNPRDKKLPAGFTIRSHPEVTTFLKEFTKPVFSLANNHIADFGRKGIEDTARALKDSGLPYVGVGDSEKDTYTPTVINMDGYSIAFFAFTDLLPEEFYSEGENWGVARLHKTGMTACIQEAQKKYDKIIVSLHTIGGIGKPLSFWPDAHQRKYYRLVAEAGADIVVGQQPHGMQLIEMHQNSLICYSLGALIYNPNISTIYPKTHLYHHSTQFRGGCLVKIIINRKTDKMSFRFYPTIGRIDTNGKIQITEDKKMQLATNLMRILF